MTLATAWPRLVLLLRVKANTPTPMLNLNYSQFKLLNR